MNEHRGLWRGKGVNNWHYGDLIRAESECNHSPIIIENGVRYSVFPSTLGECSCVPDKNHKLVFEGDVLSNKLPDPELFLCYYCDEEAGFYAKNVRTHSVYMLGALMDMTLFKLEIIGNIYDTPELIESEVNHNETQT